MTRMKKIMALLLTIVLALAFTACGSKSAPAEEPAEEPAAEETAEFDISAGMTRVDNEETGEATIDNDFFTVTLPDATEWGYDIDGTESITFFHIASREAEAGGKLFSIEVFEPEDESYDVTPNVVLGERYGKKFVVIFPSDVQADVENEANRTEYEKLFAVAQTIKADDPASPVVLKDEVPTAQ